MPEDNRPSQISEGRKTIYYVGMALAAVGGIMFACPFLGVACFLIGRVSSSPFQSDFPTFLPVTFGIGFVGFFLLAGGMMLANVGRAGLAGSGVILDPEKAREDLKPWNKMAGEMVNDTLSEIEPVQRIVEHLTEEHDASPEPPQAIRVRCRGCHALNDEDARFCDQCGAEL
jgi:hypothetical protein